VRARVRPKRTALSFWVRGFEDNHIHHSLSCGGGLETIGVYLRVTTYTHRLCPTNI
jgi:hypothetical protein